MNESHGAGGVLPYMLLNNSMRDCLVFTNFLSDHGLSIDMANMLSPTYAHWSIETWLVAGGEVFRPADDWSRVKQERDTKNSLVHLTWGQNFFDLSHVIFGARSTVDEAVIETRCVLRDRKDVSILFVVRPYDRGHFGGIESAEFVKQSLGLRINGIQSICFSAAPDYTISGEGDHGTDIDMRADERRASAGSKFGMATLGLGYELKKGENRFTMRISLEPRGEPPPGTFDYQRVKDDFTAFSTIRIRSGANAMLPDRAMQNWLYGLKISMLNVSRKNLLDARGEVDFRAVYFTVFGANRMGYFAESLECIDNAMGLVTADEKKPSFPAAINNCYLLEAFADYFIHVRDTDFLRDRFEQIKKKAHLLFNYSRTIKRSGAHDRNSLPNYSIAEEHPSDYALIAHALGQHSYLARCLGIFGEELKFKKESDRLAGIFAAAAFGGGSEDDGNLFYNLYGGFPFRLEAVDDDMLRRLVGEIRLRFGGLPLFIKSHGWDMVSTLLIANNLILLKDPGAAEIMGRLIKMKNRSYTIPEYVNPGTGRASWGEGASTAACAMMYAALRNMLFVDYPERLEIFPIPAPDWFQPGREIRVEDAPSRFGLLSFRMASTANEIQLHFSKLPKFIPPDIMINLPMKAKIKQEDDFIIKRESDSNFVINGWPTIVRFLRK